MSIRILIADDHSLIRAGLRTLLENVPDLEIVGEAGDGITLLSRVADLVHDIVLMDISMPDVDGFTLTAQLKKRGDLDGIPIIALTANVMRGDRERSLDAGCDGYIQKPINVDGFVEQILQYLSPQQ